MPIPVSLREFVNEMDTMGEELQVYLNRRTGEFLCTSPEERSAAEEDDGEDDLPAWQAEIMPKVREALSSEDWLALPSKFEIDEYAIMEDFCGTLEDETFRADLLDTIGGRGTFGRFKNMVHRHGVQDAWYRFRDQAFRQLAIGWLEAHEIPYTK